MSTDAAWYYLKGQETMGPFSREGLQQPRQEGLLLPETLMWREGMDGWVAASTIAELGLFAAVAPSPTEASHPQIQLKAAFQAQTAPPTDAAPVTEAATEPAPAPSAAPKFKLRVKTSAPAPRPASTPEPAAAGPSFQSYVPPSLAPAGSEGASQPLGGPKAFLLDADGKETKKKAPMPKWKQILLRAFSSLVWLPIFLMTTGAIAWFGQSHFPNVFWFVELAAVFAVLGLLSLAGLRFFDTWLRLLSILFLVPPALLLWPVIMGQVGWKTLPPACWCFSGFCFLYFLTTRIGLRAFLSWGTAFFAILMGLAVVGFEGAVIRGLWKPSGWNKLVEDGNQVRLPPMLVRLVGLPPVLASSSGILKIQGGAKPSVHPIEQATLKKTDGKDWQLIIQTVDDQKMTMIWTGMGEGDMDSQKIDKLKGQETGVLFGKEDNPELSARNTRWKPSDGSQPYDVESATLRITGVEGRRWSGTLTFKLPGKPAEADLKGELETTVQVP